MLLHYKLREILASFSLCHLFHYSRFYRIKLCIMAFRELIIHTILYLIAYLYNTSVSTSTNLVFFIQQYVGIATSIILVYTSL